MSEAAQSPQEPAAPAWKKLAKPALGMIVLAVLILSSIGLFNVRTPPGKVAFEPGVPVPKDALTYTIKREVVAPRVDIVGTVASEIRVKLSARIPAVVKEIFVTAGSTVKKDQVLVLLDDREIQEQVTAAEAQFKQAEAEYNRSRQLFDNKATTQQALTAAESMFTAARAQWDRSKVMLTYARIVSPMDGVVTDRRVEPGDLANPGQPLLAIYDTTRMQLETPVPVRLLDKLPVNREVEITLDRATNVCRGIVSRIVSEIDPLSRTQLVKVRIDPTPADLLPGAFGRLWVEDNPRSAILVPASAVYRVGQLEFVNVALNGRALRRAVRTSPSTGNVVEALSGLDTGDIVLANPVKEN